MKSKPCWILNLMISLFFLIGLFLEYECVRSRPSDVESRLLQLLKGAHKDLVDVNQSEAIAAKELEMLDQLFKRWLDCSSCGMSTKFNDKELENKDSDDDDDDDGKNVFPFRDIMKKIKRHELPF